MSGRAAFCGKIYGVKKGLKEPELIKKIGEFAASAGWDAYLVGGYLRDRILRRACHDLDLVVIGDATRFARDLARRLEVAPPMVYGRFGTAMLRVGHITLELASARRESYQPDSRKPRVEPANLAEDLRRRDFTINALAQSLSDGRLVDLFQGRQDIRNRVIRTPVEADKTFFDDPLRMLRAVRFAARLNFRIDPETAAAIRRNVDRLKIVSRERIAEEFLKIMASPAPAQAILLMNDLRLLPLVLPEIENLKNVVAADDRECKNVFRHTLIVLDRVSRKTRDLPTRLGALFHDIGKPATQRYVPGEGWTFHDHPLVGSRIFQEIARRFNLGAPVRNKVSRLIEFHLRPHYLAGAGVEEDGATGRAINHLVNDSGPYLASLFILAKADLTSRNENKVRRGLAEIEALEEKIRIWKRQQRRATFRLAIDGNDIMSLLALKPGPEVGKIKTELEQAVLEGKLPNQKRALKKSLKSGYNSLKITIRQKEGL